MPGTYERSTVGDYYHSYKNVRTEGSLGIILHSVLQMGNWGLDRERERQS